MQVFKERLEEAPDISYFVITNYTTLSNKYIFLINRPLALLPLVVYSVFDLIVIIAISVSE